MTLFVVRHAHAGQRSAWTGDDRIRPLSDRGRMQADGIARLLAEHEPRRLLSSPATRCIQTLEPLGTKLGRRVEVEDRLFEGIGVTRAVELVDELAETDAVLCSHGDVIPHLLRHLEAAGMTPERNLVWQKGSTWQIERVDGRWAAGRYHAPPGPPGDDD